MNTNSRPGRSGASRISRRVRSASANDAVNSSLVRNLSVESDVRTAPSLSKTNIERNDTSGPCTSMVSTHESTAPTPEMSARVWESSGVHLHHAWSSGTRLSKMRCPPGRSALRTALSVATQSSSVTKTWATFPVIVATSTFRGGIALVSPWIQRTRSAPGFVRATSSEPAAGSSPTTTRPRRASRQAKVPVPHPTSRTARASSSSTRATYASRSERSRSNGS